MKYKFSKNSMKKLKTCHSDLLILITYALATSNIDFAVVEGYRDEDRQEQLFKEGRTELHYPKSNHNQLPSCAVDLYPYPQTTKKYIELSEHIKKCSKILEIPVEWGGDWKNFCKSKHGDMPHWELRNA